MNFRSAAKVIFTTISSWPFKNALFLFLGGVDLASHVIAALRTNDMCRYRFATFRTIHALDRNLVIMGTPRTRSGIAMLSFRNCHFLTLYNK